MTASAPAKQIVRQESEEPRHGVTQLRVSFVIPARNEETMLGALLESLEALSRPEGVEIEEIIVADAESTDDTREIATRAGCRVVNASRGAASVARNAGAAVAKGNVLAFVDADCLLPSDWLFQVAHAFSDDEVVAMSTPMAAPASDASWVSRGWFRLTSASTTAESAEWLPSFNFAVRTDSFRRSGRFDADLVTCEDVEICHRLKQAGQLRFGTGQSVEHCGASESLWEFMRREAWRSRGALSLLKRYWKDPREVLSTLIPVLISLCLCATAVLCVTWFAFGWPGGMAGRTAVILTAVSGPFLLLLLALRQRVALLHLPSAILLLTCYCLARTSGCFLSVSRVQRR